MQRLEVSVVVRLIYKSLGVKRLRISASIPSLLYKCSLRAQGQIYITVSRVIHLDSINTVEYER